MENYENSCRSFGKHTVEITLQSDGYKGTFTTKMGGNCKGGSILECFCDLENFEEDAIVDNNCSLEISQDDDGEYWFNCVLTDSNGEPCAFEEEISCLNNYIVGVNIINFEEDKK